MRARVAFLVTLIALAAPSAAAEARPRRSEDRRLAAPTGWVRKIDRLVAGLPVGVSVREEGTFLYRHGDTRRRAPASNEKLLLSMAILDVLGPDAAFPTQAASLPPVAGIVSGDVWILGYGDPAVDERRLEALAREISASGVTRVEGAVRGSTGYFKRDWRAPGWKRDFPRTQVALPTALTYEGNTAGGTHIRDPELRAARALTKELQELGVRVAGEPGTGLPPEGLVAIGEVWSKPLVELLEYMNRYSSNFFAEVMGKRLGAELQGTPGSIRKGAASLRAWAASLGVELVAHDGSGLSYRNRVSPSAIVELLDAAEDEVWGEALRAALPGPGQGTLDHRLRHVDVHAKTGTLTDVSALSGWVWLRHRGVWAEFSILSSGLSKDRAVRIEDAIVRILWRFAS